MSRAPLLATTCMAILQLLPGRAAVAEPDPAATAFDLPVRGTNRKVSLQELRGHIIVLDFFAHWCVPCARSSAEVENGIRRHYAAQQGNVHGVPVLVFAVNLEAARPDKTEAFIKRTGMKQVLDDLNGEVFQDYGGGSLPFLVVIDAASRGSANSPPRIVYRRAGLEDVAEIRRVIDSINAQEISPVAATPPTPPVRPTPAAVPKAESPSPRAETASAPPVTNAVEAPKLVTGSPHAVAPPRGAAIHKVGLDFATLWASDILLTDELAEYRRKRPRSELALSVSHGYIGLHYVPESDLEEKSHVENDRFGFQTTGRFQVGDRLTLLGGGGAYDGYLDYRSLWLDEHFRQLFSGRQGYEKAHPWGWNVSGGLRWEYLPASGFLQGDLIYQYDLISPGYDVSLATFPPRLIRYRDTYDTLGGRLTLENVLTPRLRAKQELQITDTTDRQLRFAFQTSLNCALAEHWVARLAGGYTAESPQLEAWFGGATVERDWNDTWFVSLTGRYYTDTGQIENALLAENTASPPLEAFQVGLGLRWQGLKSSAKLVVGPYFTRYDSIASAANSFGQLYQDRDWLSVQFAFAHEF